MAAILPPPLAPAEDSGAGDASRRNVALARADWCAEANALVASAAGARDRATAARLWAEAAAVHAAHDSADAVGLAERALAFVPHHAAASLVIADALLRRGQRDEARAVLVPAWRVHPDDERIADALERVCDETRDWSTLDALVEARLARGGHVDRKALLLRLAQIRASRGDHAGQVRALEQLAADAAAMDVAERARAWLGAAALRAGRLTDARGAFQDAAEAFRLVPDDAETRAACERFARAAGAETELYAVLDAVAPRLAAAPDQERLVRLRAAAIAERDARLRSGAARHYERVLELSPSDREALAGLTRLALAASRWDEARALLAARAALAPPAERAALLEKLVELLSERLRDPAAAAAACREAVEVAAPEQRTRLLQRLAGLAEAAGDHPARLAALEALPAGERDPRAVIATLEELVRASSGGAERARLELRIAEVAERELGQTALALGALTRAVRAAPDLEEPRRELARVAAEVGCLADRARILADVAAAAPVHVGIAIWRELAQARDELGDAAGAADAWEQVRVRARGDAEALAALARLYEDARRLPELASVLSEARSHGDRGAATTVRLAELLALQLSLPREALPLVAEALETEPESARARRVAVALASRPDALGRKARVLATRALDGAGEAEAAAAWEAIARGSGDAEAWRAAARLHLRLGRGHDAKGAWRTVLELRSGDGEAAVELDRLLGDRDPAPERARVARAALGASGARTPQALERCARLAAEAGDPAAAVEAWREVLEAAPAQRAALDALARLGADGDPEVVARAGAVLESALRRTGDARRLMGLLEARLAGLTGAARGEVLEELAELHERLGERDAAASRWSEAARTRPTARAWAEVARIEKRRGAWAAAAAALASIAQCSDASRDRIEAWREVANVMETRLGDRDGALASWRRVLAENPEDSDALREVARLLGGAERWGELVEVLARQAALVERRPNRVADGAELRMKAARIRQERLGDADGALQMYRGVLERLPAHREAVDALHALATSGSVEAAVEVEPFHERAGDLVRWAEVLAVRAAATAEPRARAALRVRVAALHEAGGEPRQAFAEAVRALEDDPESPQAVELAERLASGRDDELRAALEGAARRAQGDEARLSLRRRLARRCADPRARAAAWSSVLELSPGDVEALDGVIRSHREAGHAAGLVDALRQRIAVTGDAPSRVLLLSELAAAEEQRGDLAAAADALRAWLDLEPDHRDALRRLEHVLAAADRPDELGDVLAREIALAARRGDVHDATSLRFRLAELRADRGGDRDGALALLEEVLAADSAHEGALARLEDVLQTDPGDARVARALMRAYERERRWEHVAAVLEVHAPELTAADERKTLLGRLAAIRERQLGSAELAFVALSRAFAEDPADAPLRVELSRLAAATGQEEDLAAALEEALERLSGSAAVDVLTQLGQLCADRLAAPDRAVEWWARAWRLDPERASPIVARLERLCAEMGRHAELADVLEWNARRLEGGARADALDRAARVVRDQLGDRDRAVALWREASAVQSRHLPSLRALSRAGEERGEPGPLVAYAEALAGAGLHQEAAEVVRRALSLQRLSSEELERLAAVCAIASARPERARVVERKAEAVDGASAPAEAAALWREAAAEWQAIGHWDGAAAALERSLSLDGDPAAFETLRDLHERRGAWADRARVCAEQAERLQDDSARAALLADAARIQEQRLVSPELAFFSWCRVLELQPDHAEAAASAERLAGDAGAWEDLAAVWEQVADACEGPRRAAALVRLAAVRERAEDHDGARAALAEALRADPGADAALERLTAALAKEGRWDEVIAALAISRDAAAPAGAAALQRRIAEITEHQLSDPEAALEAWREARRRDPRDAAALDAVERLCTDLHRWEELDALLVERAQLSGAPRDRAGWLRRSAALRDERLDDVAGALQRAEEALALDPADAATLARLARLYERAGRVADRARVLERQAAVTTDSRERMSLLVSAGEAWTRLGDRAHAEAAWREALRLDPENPDALAAVAALHEAAREWTAALEALRRLAASPRAAGRAADAWSRIGHIQQARGNAPAAEDAWRRALEVDATHLDAIRALRRSRQAAGDRTAVARLLEAEARNATDPGERARALTELGNLARDRQDVESARRWYGEAVAADATHLDAAKPLAELHVARGEWDRAAPLLETVVDHLPADSDRREAARWWHRLGLALEHLGDAPRALAAQRRARDLDGTSLPVLERLSALAERAGALEDALAAHAAVLAHHRDGLTRDERAQAHVRIAALEDALGRPLRAVAALNEALTVEPEHLDARQRLIALLEARGDFRGALEHRRRAAEALPAAARVAALADIAAIARDRLDDLPSAIEATEAAARLAPADVSLTDALVGLHLRAGQPQRAADALARLLGRPEVRGQAGGARLALALARLLRDRVRDLGGAARAFELALELDATLAEALAELEALLASDRRWRDLERVYTRLIERMPRSPETRATRVVLWKALHGLYANALADADAARTAAEVAASIEAGALAPGGE